MRRLISIQSERNLGGLLPSERTNGKKPFPWGSKNLGSLLPSSSKVAGWALSLALVVSLVGVSSMSFAQSPASAPASALEQNNRKLAQALERLNAMQREFQSIKGQVDAAGFLTQENDKVYQDLDSRVSTLEDKLDQVYNLLKEMSEKTPATGTATAASPRAQASKVQSTEGQDFQALLDLVNARDYQGAASGFLGFLKKYPNSAYAPKAMFWVGESYYFLGDYAKSIKAFQQLTQKYPQDERAKEAIYRQGLSFAKLKKYPEAKLFFQKVMADYPNTAEAAKAQTRLHRLEATQEQVAGQKPPTSSATTPQKAPPSANQPIAKPTTYPKTDPAARPNSAYDKSQSPLF